jgi:hypothetical protein
VDRRKYGLIPLLPDGRVRPWRQWPCCYVGWLYHSGRLGHSRLAWRFFNATLNYADPSWGRPVIDQRRVIAARRRIEEVRQRIRNGEPATMGELDEAYRAWLKEAR